MLRAWTVGWGVQPYTPSTLTCRVGSKEARWASCSLKALSFSSYWLGEGQARLFDLRGTDACPTCRIFNSAALSFC